MASHRSHGPLEWRGWLAWAAVRGTDGKCVQAMVKCEPLTHRAGVARPRSHQANFAGDLPMPLWLAGSVAVS